MKPLVVSAAISLTLAACAPTVSSSSSSATALAPRSHFGHFTMRMTFYPAPQKEGPERISVAVTDHTGSRVDHAVVKGALYLPAMSAPGPTVTFRGDGRGTYWAETKLTYRTLWIFDVTATAGEKSGTAEFDQEVR